MKKIIVAGAGHGGLVAAAKLARNKYDVTVIERSAEGTLGYDWTDIFDFSCLKEAGIPLPPPEKYNTAENMTFHNPACTATMVADIPRDEKEMQIERKDIYAMLISFAEQCGVKFLYNTEIVSPIMQENRVVGVRTGGNGNFVDYYADLVIDAAGLDSPVRSLLPESCNVQNKFADSEIFKVYRAFYNRLDYVECEENFQVFFFHMYEKGITWLATEKGHCDMLVGRFDRISKEIGEAVRGYLVQTNPQLGDEILRGGQIVRIPTRRPLSVMVADGYAAIGDSAAMTIPIIGSGIYNSIMAATMLVRTVLRDPMQEFTAESLWNYQVEYFDKIGATCASLDIIRHFLMSVDGEDIDFLFESGTLNSSDLASSRSGHPLKLSAAQALKKAWLGKKNLPLLLRLAGVLQQSEKIADLCGKIPRKYIASAVSAWAMEYNNFNQK